MNPHNSHPLPLRGARLACIACREKRCAPESWHKCSTAFVARSRSPKCRASRQRGRGGGQRFQKSVEGDIIDYSLSLAKTKHVVQEHPQNTLAGLRITTIGINYHDLIGVNSLENIVSLVTFSLYHHYEPLFPSEYSQQSRQIQKYDQVRWSISNTYLTKLSITN